jgi:transcriptional regulator GlxA family with amidase domain
MRIQRAKHLLAETDLKLSVIAQQCGIRSGARFAAVFKRMTGHRPSVFRCLAGDRLLDQGESFSAGCSLGCLRFMVR